MTAANPDPKVFPGEVLLARLPKNRLYRLLPIKGGGTALLCRTPIKDDHRLRDARRQLTRRLEGSGGRE